MQEGGEKTKVVFHAEARRGLLAGLSTVAHAVGCTLGPRGKTVIIQRPGFAPLVTKDGVSVAKAINLSDPLEGLGGELIKQAAERTNDVAGDGTTTATVLTHAMVVEGNRLIENGNNAQLVCKGINLGVDSLVAFLRNSARHVKTTDEIAQVATISANGDSHIGKLVAAAMNQVGRDGIITVEDAKGTDTSLDVVEGLRFERGYLSPYFCTNTERMHALYDDTRVLVTDKKLSEMKSLVPILEKVMQARTSLLIIADDIDGEALQTLVINRVKNNLPVVAVKAPGYAAQRDDLLSDICVLTGAKLASSKTGVSLEKLDFTQLGSLKRVIVDAKTTTLVTDNKTRDAVKSRIEELRAQTADVTLGADQVGWLKARIAGLSAGVAIIRVGGATELEMVERKHRIEDALHATRAAAEEGIVPGGGIALFHAALKSLPKDDNEHVQLGISLVFHACQAPLRRIVENANGKPDVVLSEAQKKIEGNPTELTVGYDAVTETFRDMFEAGIVDPVKVCRTALQHAASVAVTFMNLDAVVYQEAT